MQTSERTVRQLKRKTQNAKQDMEWPETWKVQLVDGKRVPEDGLFTVQPTDSEYWDVFDKLRATQMRQAGPADRREGVGLKGMATRGLRIKASRTDLSFNHFRGAYGKNMQHRLKEGMI